VTAVASDTFRARVVEFESALDRAFTDLVQGLTDRFAGDAVDVEDDGEGYGDIVPCDHARAAIHDLAAAFRWVVRRELRKLEAW
jgi:hypothetical protein